MEVGNIFVHVHKKFYFETLYRITCIDGKTAFINMETGNLFSSAIKVKNPFNITLHEFHRLTSNQSKYFHKVLNMKYRYEWK